MNQGSRFAFGISLRIVAAVTVTAVGIACGKSKKSKTAADSGTETVASSDSLAITYPEGMSVGTSSTTAPTSSANDPTTVAYASGSLAIPSSSGLSLTDDGPYDPEKVSSKDRILAAAKRLKGEADECLPPYLFNPAPKLAPACYSPDGDMVQVGAQFPNAAGLTPDGEACLAAFSRAQIAEVSQIVDQAQALVEGMICAAYKDNKSQKLPKPGETLDLADTFTEITGAKKVDSNSDLSSPTGAPNTVTGTPPKDLFRIALAKIQRLENTTDRAQFLSTIVMEVNGTVRHIRLMHMPSLTSGNNDYVGRLSIKTIRVQRTGIQDNKQNYLDINYMMDLDPDDGRKPKTRYRLLRASFDHANLVAMQKDPFAGIGQLDLNVGARFEPQFSPGDPLYGSFPSDSTSNFNSTLAQVNRIDYAGNPITGEGMFSFWVNPGGNFSEAARGMIASRRRESPDSTRLIGCAISGAALKPDISGNYSIRKAQKENILLKPTGYYHPGGTEDLSNGRVNASCAAGQCQMAPYVYRQCYRQDDQGRYVPDLTKITDQSAKFDVLNAKVSGTIIDALMPVVDGKIQAPK